MKKTLLLCLSAFILTGCGALDALKDLTGGTTGGSETGENNGDGTSQQAELPTIESLYKKYSGFEVTYTTNETRIYVGAQNDMYWLYIVDYDTYETLSSTIVSVKDGNEWINYNYVSGEYVTYGRNKDTNMAAQSINTYYLQFMQANIGDTKGYSSKLRREDAIKYTFNYGEIALYVHATDGYTMEVDFGNEQQGFVFYETRKGESVIPVELNA